MAKIEKRAFSWAKRLKAFVGLVIATMVAVFAGFVFVNTRRLGWTIGWI